LIGNCAGKRGYERKKGKHRDLKVHGKKFLTAECAEEYGEKRSTWPYSLFSESLCAFHISEVHFIRQP
jgi:hypothetical protein